LLELAVETADVVKVEVVDAVLLKVDADVDVAVEVAVVPNPLFLRETSTTTNGNSFPRKNKLKSHV
jgi:hypothetical protein